MRNIVTVTPPDSFGLEVETGANPIILPAIWTQSGFGDRVQLHASRHTSVGSFMQLRTGQVQVNGVLIPDLFDLMAALAPLVSRSGGGGGEHIDATARASAATALSVAKTSIAIVGDSIPAGATRIIAGREFRNPTLAAIVLTDAADPTTDGLEQPSQVAVTGDIVVPGGTVNIRGRRWRNLTVVNITVPPTLDDAALAAAGLVKNTDMSVQVATDTQTLSVNTNYVGTAGHTYAMPDAAAVDVSDGLPWVLIRREIGAGAFSVTGALTDDTGADIASVDPDEGNIAYVLTNNPTPANRRWQPSNI